MRKQASPTLAFALFLGCLFVLTTGLVTVQAANVYVPGTQPTIQAGINSASNGDTVYVADGTWKGSGNKNLNFNGKAITVRSENGPENCIIDCEQSGRGFKFENDEGASSVLDGFTIINGSTAYGGAIYVDQCSPTIQNCIFLNNRGYDGIAAGYGGGIYCYDWVFNGGPCKPTIINCIFSGNSADYGGGIYNYSDGVGSTTEPTLIHCTFSGNHSDIEGGGMYNWQSDPTVKNCIFWGNTAGTLYPQIRDFSSNSFITYSDVQGGFSGTGNIDQDPLFVGGGDFHLTSGSPCVDKGTDAAVYEDIDGDVRPYLTGYDMGADEYFEPCWDGDFDGYTDEACGGDDCNDANPFIFPTNPNSYCNCLEPHPQGTDEIPGDGIDNDCDGAADEPCFIATAAFGSELDSRIDVLRTFRDIHLQDSPGGKAFVKAYYELSPPIADFIAEKGWLRTLVRILLLPVIGLASLFV